MKREVKQKQDHSAIAMLRMLGPRPSADAVEAARQELLRIDVRLAAQLANMSVEKQVQEKEKGLKEAGEREKLPFKAVIQLDKLHQSYQELAEHSDLTGKFAPFSTSATSGSDGNVEVEKNIQEAVVKKFEILDLSSRALKTVPNALGDLASLRSLNLSNNQLEILPNAIAGLVNLVTLDVHSNQLKILPDAIGSLSNLKHLNVAGNMLRALPGTIGCCCKLVELNANFNQLDSWLSNLGEHLSNLQKLRLHLNNFTGLPASIGQFRSLRVLDLHSNKLRSLPSTIGNLSNLESLNVSRNFNNLCTLPDSIGDLKSLTALDLSFNQIRELPASIGNLKNLKRLKLDQNPLVIPPKDVIDHSHEAVMAYLAVRLENGSVVEDVNGGQTERKVASRGTNCLMIPMSPRHEHPGGWVPVRPGNRWMSNLLAPFVCGSMGNVLGGTMKWQEHHSDDDN